MGDIHASPGRLERWILAIPDGAVLRVVFFGLLMLGGAVLARDFQSLYGETRDAARTQRTEPMPLPRPSPGDQRRPYLPRAIPVAPDRGEPRIPGYDAPAAEAAMSAAMRFVMVDGSTATAVGRIEPGSADAFERFLKTEGNGVERVILHSPGGAVSDALRMARLVRERGLKTDVPADGYCASACPLVLAGGIERHAGEGAWVGVHQVYALSQTGRGPVDADASIADVQATIAQCQQLLIDMGVDSALWIHAMQTPANELYVLTPEELATYRLVTPPAA